MRAAPPKQAAEDDKNEKEDDDKNEKEKEDEDAVRSAQQTL
ncbi:hypothetical protein N9S81_00095 [bacterium]|nr:hypothetical protein [bacterium]